MLKYGLHKDFKYLETLIPNISDWFQNNGTTIYKIRNEIKVIEVDGLKLCVKSFGQPRVINQFVYAYFRKSKAYRSYRNANKLLDMGIGTPQPVAWVEFRNKNNYITESYYISLYLEHDFTMDWVINHNSTYKEKIIQAFATFVQSKLHKNGVLHRDLGPNNVLVKKVGKEYTFSVVDVNRMSFKKNLTRRKRLVNLRRIGGGPIEMSMLAKHYSNLQNQDPILSTILLGVCKYRFQKSRNLRKAVFAPFRTKVLVD